MLHTHEPRAAVKIPLPKNFPRSIRASFETAIEAHIAAAEAITAQAHLDAAEALLAALDEADGDRDLEETGDDEPGEDAENTYTETHGGYPSFNGRDDYEPSLAHTLDFNQARAKKNLGAGWGGGYSDVEAEHDGREHAGWSERIDQTALLNGSFLPELC